jgi:uncharacterized protein
MRALLVALLMAGPAAADIGTVVQHHIRPGFAAFATAAKSLADIEGCDPATLRPAFHAAYDAWMAVAHLPIGPADEDGRGLAIQFWPDPKGLGAKAQRALLTGDPATLAPETFARQSVAARGLSGLERLLYPAKPLPADPCPLIRATADDMARLGAELATGWDPYGDLLITAGQPGNTRYLATSEARQALFTQLATSLEYIADRRIGRPLAAFDKPRPDLAEARASGRPLRNVTLQLHALRAFALALSPESPKTAAAFDHALTLAADLDDPEFAGITDPQAWLRLEILQQAVRAARVAAIAEIAPALGVSLGFNAQDGD